jgi:hypothetical protein
VKVTAGETFDLGRLALDDGLTLRVRVVAGEDDASVPDARVDVGAEDLMLTTLTDLYESGHPKPATGADGRFEATGLVPGTFTVRVVHPEFAPEQRRVEIPAGVSPPELVVRLRPGGAVAGTVRDGDGQPVAEAMVLLSNATPLSALDDTHLARTGPDEGLLDVTVLARGWAPLRRSGVLPPERHDDPGLELRVGRGGSVRVRIVDAAGRPLPGLRPVARAVPPFVGSEFLLEFDPVPPTDAVGESLIERLAPGEHEVRVAGREDVPPVRVTVLEGAETSVTLRLPVENASP